MRPPDTAAAWRIALGALLDAVALVLPVDCSGCGAPDRAVCTVCAAALVQPLLHRRIGTIDVVSAAAYDGVVAAIVVAFKDSGRTDAAHAIGGALRWAVSGALAIAADCEWPIELTPMPSSRAAIRRRGYRPVQLALHAARLPSSPTLRVVRSVRDQASLSAEERHRNLVGSMAARADLSGRAFILVDDVLTTGASITEASRAIRAAGGCVLGAATVASTALHRAPVGRPNRGVLRDPQVLPSDSGETPD
ncbi:ComF family protein [Naasia lichenicola]|uniref:ComF family protein n=1 Tax=Naasia lichenicola TaxID=2565933 RepID=A0A4S4FNX5_9MICO|nr:phosphoribosyltransferase family protein [Naasia lichenicola]THG30711.1 ComF family protein [Naasia lichenicola]THG31948.1 ComF family protein [Naasia lichenicola]